MSFLTTIAQLARRPDPRSDREIDDDIVEELAFHVEMRARDFVADGFAPDEARRRAEACFGDFETIRRRCRAEHLEERVMLQRVQTVLILVLVVTVGVLAWGMVRAERRSRVELARMRDQIQSMSDALAARRAHEARAASSDAPLTASELRAILEQNGLVPRERAEEAADGSARPDPEHDPATWIARFAARPTDWRYGWSLAEEIAKLPPEIGERVLREAWPTLSAEVKQQVLKPFVFGAGHPRALAVLHLAATDADPETQRRALEYLRGYAFQDFALDYEAYVAWHARFAERPVEEVLEENARALVQRVSRLEGDELVAELARYERANLARDAGGGRDLAAVLREEGGVALLERMLADSSETVQESALEWAGRLGVDETWAREHVLPRIERSLRGSDKMLSAAFSALGRPELGFAREPVAAAMSTRLERRGDDDDGSADSVLWSGAQSLAAMGDPRAIPDLIAMIASRPACYDTVYGIGYFGLGKLTGVEYDEAHDGEWWLRWWEANATRYSEDVRARAAAVLGR